MYLDQAVNSVIGGQKRARVLSYLGPLFPEVSKLHVCEAFLGDLQITLFVPSGPANPEMYAVSKNGILYVFIGGAETQAHVQAIWDGYQGSNLALGNNTPTNGFFRAAAILFYDAIFHRFDAPLSCFIAGHSAGGAIAYYLRNLMKEAFWVLNPKVITFGSPRAGWNGLASDCTEENSCRWMNVDDPVPDVPRNSLSLVNDWGFAPRWTRQRLERFAHPEGGVQIGLLGDLTPAHVPQITPDPGNVVLERWRSQMAAGERTAHSIQVYDSRLELATPAIDQPRLDVQTPLAAAPRVTPTANAEPVVISPYRQAVREENTVVATLFLAGDRQNNRSPAVPSSQLFQAFRVGRAWYVRFGDQVICGAPTKKRARGLANAGNAFMRRLLLQGVVNPETLLTQLETFLTVAQDPSSGIVPTLRTTL